MTDAPEKLWVEPDGETLIIHNGSSDLEELIATGYLHEYTRTDITDALVEELSYIKANYYLQPKPKMQSGQLHRKLEFGVNGSEIMRLNSSGWWRR
tara:strand:+ start:596 stop:883 length:288 start_codon:yes stop_codon:yes gene_type:complete